MDTFIALLTSLPTGNSTTRMRVWRALKETGCGVLRDGVYVLPAARPRRRRSPSSWNRRYERRRIRHDGGAGLQDAGRDRIRSQALRPRQGVCGAGRAHRFRENRRCRAWASARRIRSSSACADRSKNWSRSISIPDTPSCRRNRRSRRSRARSADCFRKASRRPRSVKCAASTRESFATGPGPRASPRGWTASPAPGSSGGSSIARRVSSGSTSPGIGQRALSGSISTAPTSPTSAIG